MSGDRVVRSERKSRWAWIVPVVLLSSLALRATAMAQTDEVAWSAPVNLSHSGAASQPVVVASPGGTVQVFWWDQFDGLMTAIRYGETWSAPIASPIYVYVQIRDEVEAVPVAEMAQITADRLGYAHAWWLGTPDEETGLRPLLHSRLAIGNTAWSAPDVAASSALRWHVAADGAGTLHLAYVRAVHDDLAPAGVYYRRSFDGGVSWTFARALYSTIYFRLLSEEETHVWVAADATGRVGVAWDDPRLDRSFVARSTDGGASWGEAWEVGGLEEDARRTRVFSGPEGEALLLWEAGQMGTSCALYQERLADGAETWEERQRVLEDLGTCPESVRLLSPENERLLLEARSGGGLVLAAWDGDRWSEPRRLSFGFLDPEMERQVYLSSLQAALAGETLVVVGTGQDGEVWVLDGEVAALEWVFAPPLPWSEPIDLGNVGQPGLPAVAADDDGRVHVLWSESDADAVPGSDLVYARWDGTRWTSPAVVLGSPEGKAVQPSLAVVGDRVHAVWSGGPNGEILYSAAYARDAYAAGGWSDPFVLPAPGDVGAWPSVIAGVDGTLYVVYAVPLNEDRGVYVTRSIDDGATWSEAWTVFDGVIANWPMIDHPMLVADGMGKLTAVWVRGSLPGSGPAQGIYVAVSEDGGEHWSEPWAAAEGNCDWPRLAATTLGELHLLWAEGDGDGSWRHRLSVDGGLAWTRPAPVRGFEMVPGPVGLAADPAGAVYLVGLGWDNAGEPSVLYAAWDGQRWGEAESYRAGTRAGGESGVAVGLRPLLGALDVVYREAVVAVDGASRVGVMVASRSVAAVAPTPLSTPMPSPTALPLATATPRPTPRPTVPAEAPPPSRSVEFGPLSLPLVAVGGLVVAALIVVGVLATRGLWTGRQ